MSKKIGRQTPTNSLILPYTETKGQEASKLYKKTGRVLRKWQDLLLYDILAINDEGLWIHSRFGYAVPRRNGKTESVIARIIYGIENGEKVLYTAHLIPTSHSVFETICALLDNAEIKYASNKARGAENIRLINPKTGKPYALDHQVNFRTRSSTNGLGEGYDLLIVDEAQEYTIDQESSLKYVTSASPNPQEILLGTPPTAISHGTVFQKLREKVLEGGTVETGWAEWSVEHMKDPYDIEAWYETNPSLGQGLTERAIRKEISTDDVDFNIQRLGHWLSYSQASEFSEKEWRDLQVHEIPNFTNKLYVGIKFGSDGKHVAMSIATKVDDKIFVEAIDCQSVRNGNIWLVSFLKEADVEKVVIDGSGSQQILSNDLKEFNVKLKPILPKVNEVIVANNMFEQAVTSTKLICHNGQPSLEAVVTNCKRRAIGSNGGFGFKALLEEHDIALLDSVILAHWICAKSKGTKIKQKVNY